MASSRVINNLHRFKYVVIGCLKGSIVAINVEYAYFWGSLGSFFNVPLAGCL